MATLLLHLEGPMQAWSTSPRLDASLPFRTECVPTLSGVTGIIASAMGLPRGFTDMWPSRLVMGVRIDRPGSVRVDYQTITWRTAKTGVPRLWRHGDSVATSVAPREYIADAKFTVALQGDDETVAHAADALAHPSRPLSLGLRSCPPTRRILCGVVDGTVMEALTGPCRHADGERGHRMVVDVRALPDGPTGAAIVSRVRDVPVPDPRMRRYAMRSVAEFETRPPRDDDAFDFAASLTGPAPA